MLNNRVMGGVVRCQPTTHSELLDLNEQCFCWFCGGSDLEPVLMLDSPGLDQLEHIDLATLNVLLGGLKTDLTKRVICKSCGKVWRETYKLMTIEEVPTAERR